jgi:hypothetical protein
MEFKKSIEVLDESTYIVGSRRGDSSHPGIKTNGQLGGDLGQPFLWRATTDKPATAKAVGSGQWPLGADRANTESKVK